MSEVKTFSTAVLRQREKYRRIYGIVTLLIEKLAFEGLGKEEVLHMEEKEMRLIKPRSKKFWYIDFVANGKRNRWSTKCEKRGAAEMVRDKMLKELVLSEQTLVEKKIKQDHRLDEAFKKYLEEYSKDIKLSHKRDLLSAANILRDMENLKISEVTPETVYKWQQKRKDAFFKNGKQLSPRTVNIERSFLHRVFELARNQWNWLEKNPVTPISPLPYDGARNKCFTEAERATLLALCERHGYYWFRDLLELLWLTGLRIGEVLSLTCGQVFLDAELPYIRLTREKSRILMEYPLTVARVRDLLQKLCSGKTANDYVFTLDGKPIDYQKARRCWERVRKAAGFDDAHMHDSRHTFATVCHDHELDDMTIKNLLGQKTIQVTRQYIHPSLETVGKRLKRIDEEKVFGTLLAPLVKNEVLS
ncbi:MAG TPA: tyrosine-type recombinase/integrase [bacterium]|nr:tyrosine-type recombinase/integrase [bacterium]